MDIIQELNNRTREVKIGDIYRLLDTTDTDKYLSESKPLMKVVSVKKKNTIICDEKHREWCSEVHDSMCINFETITGDKGGTWSCYCKAEYVNTLNVCRKE